MILIKNKTFKFRRLTTDDFPLLLDWLSRGHVKKWWDDGDDTLEKVARHYGNDDDTRRFILLKIDETPPKPIGYFQYYFAEEERVIGIDQFLAEEGDLNKGVGEKTIKIFIEMISELHAPEFIVLDPSPENKRAIRCYEKVGFKFDESGAGDSVYLMKLEIRNFIK